MLLTYVRVWHVAQVTLSAQVPLNVLERRTAAIARTEAALTKKRELLVAKVERD